MKKNFLIALVALLAVALNGNAQNNTYNMVIEMANGTKITIGPNDVKNISFNNGELVMTGEDINTLVEQQNKTQARIDSLCHVVEGNLKDLLQITRYELYPLIQKNIEDIQFNADEIYMNKGNIEKNSEDISKNLGRIEALTERVIVIEQSLYQNKSRQYSK